MEVMLKFMLWFSVSLVLAMMLLNLVSHKFIAGFIIALVISLIATRENK